MTPNIPPFLLLPPDVWEQTLQLMESYKAGMLLAAPGARGIAPPNLHTEGTGD